MATRRGAFDVRLVALLVAAAVGRAVAIFASVLQHQLGELCLCPPVPIIVVLLAFAFAFAFAFVRVLLPAGAACIVPNKVWARNCAKERWAHQFWLLGGGYAGSWLNHEQRYKKHCWHGMVG